ncbi:DUF4843 domain-containing protein [Pinibacter aurantiacus]|uniref:DUF4843 domain-containing protein n=1 Tax=Pinibacter aurantiacus TaxID=2851599 RepID=A0A9E2S6I0_9BACT|nr:DUF4843 domain-containing protein [Pinibacter aurantiacus]MBV4355882.1 DUF4843 domain-containing protein [Pinibacter aurantiacus]
MRYKHILPAFVSVVIIAAGCSKNKMETYQQKPAVYFASFTDTNDSLTRSLAGSLTESDTVFLTINLLGDKLAEDKEFTLTVNPSKTDAVEGVHFEKLKEKYVFPKGAYSVQVPVILYKKDAALDSKYFSLGLTIKATGDLDAGYPFKLNARILFTNQLVKPSYWDSWLSLYYGAYSRVKHNVCIHFQGGDFPATQAIATKAPYNVSYWMSYGRVVCLYFTNNIVNDENGNRILPWAAF